ncbi:MAG: 50S ribosomal L9 C-terminal domain-containing protein [Candidatus Gracilibacteria bacterium]|nr:50S ribosomal L9 C-terminal domain-containing protein [Candidatus Gracilibacteria bacterium]
MPKGFAQQATTEMIDRMRNTIVAKREAVKMASSDASAHARALSGAVIHLSGKASEKGTLFKALLEQDVVDAIMEEYSIEVEPEQIVMAHIKKIGEHAIGVQLDGQVVEIKADVALEGE